MIFYFTFFIQISKKPYFIVFYEIRPSCEKNTGFQPISCRLLCFFIPFLGHFCVLFLPNFVQISQKVDRKTFFLKNRILPQNTIYSLFSNFFDTFKCKRYIIVSFQRSNHPISVAESLSAPH